MVRESRVILKSSEGAGGGGGGEVVVGSLVGFPWLALWLEWVA